MYFCSHILFVACRCWLVACNFYLISKFIKSSNQKELDRIRKIVTEINLLDGVSGLVQADLTKLAAIDSTAAEINLIDGGTARGTTALADGDGILINDAGTMRMTNVTAVKTYMAGSAATKGFATAMAIAL